MWKTLPFSIVFWFKKRYLTYQVSKLLIISFEKQCWFSCASTFSDFGLWFFLHIVFSAGVSLLHAYLTSLWTSRSFPWFVCFSTRTSFSLPCQKPWGSWLQPLGSSHTFSSLQVFPFSMLILHPFGLQGLFRDLFVFLREPVFHFHV